MSFEVRIEEGGLRIWERTELGITAEKRHLDRANYREANRAESHDDFIHKVGTCEKEAAEAGYWLELALEANLTTSTLTKEKFESC